MLFRRISLSKTFGWEYERVAIGLNITWIAVLLFTGMSLSAQLGSVWCPIKSRQVGKDLTASLNAQTRLEEAHVRALQRRKNTEIKLQNLNFSNEKMQRKKIFLRGKRSATRDTGVEGTTAVRFEEISNAVQSGELKPTISSIRNFAKCGTATTQKYKKKLEQVHIQ